MNKQIILFLVILLFFTNLLTAQVRPLIWVQNSEKEAILQKIEQQPWAKSMYDKFLERMEGDLKLYQKKPADFLKKLPFNREKQKEGLTPPLYLIRLGEPGSGEKIDEVMKYLKLFIDCGMLYYLRKVEKYAQCANDILNAKVQGISQIHLPKGNGNFGWMMSEDYLYGRRKGT